MDLTPLKNGFEAKVDPKELAEFAQQFDLKSTFKGNGLDI